MSDIQQLLSTLKRPGLLVRAARHGLAHYDRSRHLRRILHANDAPSPWEAAHQLFELEQFHESRRCDGDGAYSVQNHIEVLCALMAEARLMQGALPRQAKSYAKASAMPAFLRAM